MLWPSRQPQVDEGEGPAFPAGAETGLWIVDEKAVRQAGSDVVLSVEACLCSLGRPLLWSAAPSVGVIFI